MPWFQRLPHKWSNRSLGDVAIDRYFLILVSLAEYAAFALLDFRRFPRGVEVVKRDEPFLDVGAGAHLLGAADKHADAALPYLLEQ